MKITYADIRKKNSFFDWFFIHAVTLKDKQSGERVINKLRPEDGKWDIKFTVEGVELPLLETFEDLQKQDEERITEKAVELMEEKLHEITEALMDMQERGEREVKAIIRGEDREESP